jgi:phage shock protein E
MRFLIAALLVLAAGCSESKSAASVPPPPSGHDPVKARATPDPATARTLIADGAVVLDVRTAGEYAGGHVASATNLPVGEVTPRIAEIDKLVGGDKTRPVVVYCAKGGRAETAKQQLEAAGYTRVVNGGGYDDLSD